MHLYKTTVLAFVFELHSARSIRAYLLSNTTGFHIYTIVLR